MSSVPIDMYCLKSDMLQYSIASGYEEPRVLIYMHVMVIINSVGYYGFHVPSTDGRVLVHYTRLSVNHVDRISKCIIRLS